MIGLDIKVKNEYNNYLYKIFNGINLSDYIWDIITDDILYINDGDLKENIFSTDVIEGDEFLKCISKDSYYMIFVDIKAYPIGNQSMEIEIFEDFMNSNCVMILLCTDSAFIEFYCKDKEILDKVFNNCVGTDFETVEYLSVADITRRTFMAW